MRSTTRRLIRWTAGVPIGILGLVAATGPVPAAPRDDRPAQGGKSHKQGSEPTSSTSSTSTTTAAGAASEPSGKSSSGGGASASSSSTSSATAVVTSMSSTSSTSTSTTGVTVVPGEKVKAASAHGLTIETLTWGVVGLDSTDVTDGPNTYPVGVRVCATGGAVSDITVTFTWDSLNPYLNLVGTSVLSIASLADGACADRYFFVVVTRDTAAYDTSRAYHITVGAPGVTSVSTPVPRELYVEKLLSQNRNTVLGISGPTTVYEGDTVTYTVEASTAPNGYSQLTSFLTMLDPIFSLLEVSLAYETPGGSASSPYVDACGWDDDPGSPTYRSCVGPAKVAGGRVGGTILGTFAGIVVGTGSTTMSNAIIDVSGGSYHYNSDFGSAPNLIGVVALPSADLALAKAAVGTFVAGQTGSFRLTVTNRGPSASGTPLVVTDTLPAGMTFVGATGSGWQCTASGQTVMCTTSTGLAAGASSSVTVTVALAESSAGARVNTATVAGPARDLTPADNTARATAQVLTAERARDLDVGPGGAAGPGGATGAGILVAVGEVDATEGPAGSTRLAVTGFGTTAMLTAQGLALIGFGLLLRRTPRRRSAPGS